MSADYYSLTRSTWAHCKAWTGGTIARSLEHRFKRILCAITVTMASAEDRKGTQFCSDKWFCPYIHERNAHFTCLHELPTHTDYLCLRFLMLQISCILRKPSVLVLGMSESLVVIPLSSEQLLVVKYAVELTI